MVTVTKLPRGYAFGYYPENSAINDLSEDTMSVRRGVAENSKNIYDRVWKKRKKK